MKLINLFWIQLSLWTFGVADGQSFHTSIKKMNRLLESEKKVVEILQDYLQTAKEKLGYIEKYINRYLEIYKDVNGNQQYFTQNPINNFLLIRRTSADIATIENILVSDTVEDVLNNITEMQNEKLLPSDADLDGAAESLIILQKTYNLETEAFARGIFRNKLIDMVGYSKLRMTSRDCLYIGNVLISKDDFVSSMEWYETANMTMRDNYSDAFTLEVTEMELQDSIEQAILNSKITKKDASNIYNEKPTEVKPNRALGSERYRQLCRGEKLRTTEEESQLFCRYFEGHHPFYQLQPLKMEVMSNYPFIAMLYDIISEKEMKEFQEISIPMLRRSLLYNPSGESNSGSTRTSHNAWVTLEASPIVSAISRKSEMILGISPGNKNTSEEYQIANYGVGGHYVPHTDYLQSADGTIMNCMNNPCKSGGDRIATLMYYISDVIAGGYTVFPILGVSIKPVKGAAVFWWNLLSSGEGNSFTVHGGCPILLGHKWIANKWFRSNDQMFLKKCHVKPKEPHLDI